MTTKTYLYSTTLVVVDCGECGIPHGLPKDLQTARLADGGHWYCPNGHYIAYTETESRRLARELKAERDNAVRLSASLDQAEASRRAWKGQATKLRNRAVDGECPFCGQHLRDLERHIGRIHADEASADPEMEPAAEPSRHKPA